MYCKTEFATKATFRTHLKKAKYCLKIRENKLNLNYENERNCSKSIK